MQTDLTMSQDARAMPGNVEFSECEAVERMLSARGIAVVGLSDKPDRPGNEVPAAKHAVL